MSNGTARNWRRRFDKVQVGALRDIELLHGSIHYINAYDLEREFYARTGVYRESSSLYMANWRRRQGLYDSLLAS